MEENNNREGEDGLENCNNIGTQFSQWDNQTTQNIINQFMLLSLNEQTNIGKHIYIYIYINIYIYIYIIRGRWCKYTN